jgi:hypothetical protein
MTTIFSLSAQATVSGTDEIEFQRTSNGKSVKGTFSTLQAGITTTGTVSTGTWSSDVAADTIDDIGEIAAALKSGADGTLITGTAGTSGDLSIFNADGDLVDGPTPPSGTIVGTTDVQTLANKVINDTTNTVHADAQHLEIRNESGGAITIGQAVYISGYSVGQDLPLVTLADASAASTMPAIGLVEDASIANNANGGVLVTGRLSGIDTSGFSQGDPVYVSTTAGALSTKPTGAGDQVQKIGVVLRSHATLGVVHLVGAGRINDIPNSMEDTVFRVVDDGDATKVAMFQASGITTATTRTFTFPDNDGTLITSGNLTDITTTGTVATGTWSADLAADTVDAITEISAGLKSGADTTLITGTAGTSGDLSQWNADGDLVDGPTPPSGTIVGTSDTQTLTNKVINTNDNNVRLDIPAVVSDTTDILATADVGMFIRYTSGSAVTVTVNSVAAGDVGGVIHLMQDGAGQVSVSSGTCTVRKSATFNASTEGENAVITLVFDTTTTAILMGMLEAA